MAARPKLIICSSFTPTAAAAPAAIYKLGYAALIGYIWVVRAAAAAAAAVGIEDEGRFNFGRSADYPWPQAKKKL